MKQHHETDHEVGASISNDDITARQSEIEEHGQMEAAVVETGSNGMMMERGNNIEEDMEIEIEEEAGFDGFQPFTEIPRGDGDDVYVAVGKSDSSFDALSWALKNAVKPGSFVYLIHVFPEVHQIPTLLGNLPKHSASKDQVDNYMNQERLKRHQMLQRYLNLCRRSKVEFDVHLIESNYTETAILELIPVLLIKILVVGTSKANLRRLKRGGTKAGTIQKRAPEYCEVKIICEGQDVSTITSVPDQTPPASPLASPLASESIKTERRELTQSPEIHTINRSSGSPNSTKEKKFKKLFRYFSCNGRLPTNDN